MSFERNAFINCPFDKQYENLKKSILFTLIYAGLIPKISTQNNNALNSRLDGIIKLMKESKIGIHDISRIPTRSNPTPRFNMPFELGIDFGLYHSKKSPYNKKFVIVMDSKRYRAQVTTSDLSGIDPLIHNNKPEVLIRELRRKLHSHPDLNLPPADEILDRFQVFMASIKGNPKKISSDQDFIELATKFCSPA